MGKQRQYIAAACMMTLVLYVILTISVFAAYAVLHNPVQLKM